MDHNEQVDYLKKVHAELLIDIQETKDALIDAEVMEQHSKQFLDMQQRANHLGVLIDYFDKYGHLPICDETMGNQ